MATLPKEEPATNQIHEVPKDESEHQFNAAAHVLSADLELPVTREVNLEAHVRLEPDGAYKFQPTGHLRLEGIISYQSGYTQVGGHKSPKPGHGFVTLTTSVVEGLNILDVLTADRVVGQISTEHPEWPVDEKDARPRRQVPTVTFLGTRFENLRIAGREVTLDTQFDILGLEPKDDRSYLEDKGVLDRVFAHYDRIKDARDLPDWAKEKEHCWNQDAVQPYGDMKCSLVKQIRGAPGIPFGHVLDLPHFGKIFLAELTVTRKPAKPGNGYPNPETYVFHLEMVRVQLGCLAQGTATVVTLDTNGTGGHH
jgi:hypothetical protein